MIDVCKIMNMIGFINQVLAIIVPIRHVMVCGSKMAASNNKRK